MMRPIHHHCHQHTHNQHINNINNKDTIAINATYELVHFLINYQGKELLLMNAKSNPVSDYHIPPDCILTKTSLSSANHPHAIFEA